MNIKRIINAHRVCVIMVAVALFASCKEKRDLVAEASQAAMAYYQQLMAGDYNGFVEGLNNSATMHETYKEQMSVAMKQYMAQQTEEHRGIRDVRLVDGELTGDSSVNVMVMLCFGDSTKEEVCIPMVTNRGQWKMK